MNQRHWIKMRGTMQPSQKPSTRHSLRATLNLRAMEGLTALVLPVLLSVSGCEAPTPLTTTHRDVVDLSSAATSQVTPLPSDSSQRHVTVQVGEVASAVLITGRPRVVCEYVRKTLIECLQSSRNLCVLDPALSSTPTGVKGDFLIEGTITAFSRDTHKKKSEGQIAYIGAVDSKTQRRQGIFELEVRLIDPASRAIVKSFSTDATLSDSESLTTGNLLGFSGDSDVRQRSTDSDAICLATHEACVRLWDYLIKRS